MRFLILGFTAIFSDVAFGLPVAGPLEEVAAQCAALKSLDFAQTQDAPTRITEAQLIDAKGGVPLSCQVVGYVAPQVGFEIRLPSLNWNGKFLQVGCGGMCGALFSGACDAPLQRGYACIASDMGHKGRPDDGGLWAYNNLQAEVDFAYRATHVATLAGKAITQRYYRQAPLRSYFMGCSQGGRQGLVSVQRFPWDFDGVIAGAPAIEMTSIASSRLQYYLWAATRGEQDDRGQDDGVLPQSAIQLIHAAATARCDLDDGVKDGIIGNPTACQFNPDELVCRSGAETVICLTELQAEAANKIYSGAATSAGENLYPGPAIGSELEWIRSSEVNFLRYMAFVPDPGPSWQPTDYDVDRDHKRLGMMESLFSASNPDLRRFKGAGGKLIMYAGWNDANNVPGPMVDYYETVERTMGGRKATQDFFRLFMLPGVSHCSGGIGADAVDLLSYLEVWVERGQAPDRILSAHTIDGDAGVAYPYRQFPSDPAKARFTRPVYPYPKRAIYKGSGDPNDAANFFAVEP